MKKIFVFDNQEFSPELMLIKRDNRVILVKRQISSLLHYFVTHPQGVIKNETTALARSAASIPMVVLPIMVPPIARPTAPTACPMRLWASRVRIACQPPCAATNDCTARAKTPND